MYGIIRRFPSIPRMISGRSRGSQAVLQRSGGCFGRWDRCLGAARAGSCWLRPQMGITGLYLNYILIYILTISWYIKSQCHCALACSLLLNLVESLDLEDLEKTTDWWTSILAKWFWGRGEAGGPEQAGVTPALYNRYSSRWGRPAGCSLCARWRAGNPPWFCPCLSWPRFSAMNSSYYIVLQVVVICSLGCQRWLMLNVSVRLTV